MHSLFRHIVLCEHVGKLASTVVAEVVEDDSVALLDQSHRLAALGDDHRFDKFVSNFSVIGSAYRLLSALEASSLALHEHIVGLLHTVPALVAVHCIEASANRSHLAGSLGHLLFEFLDKTQTAPRIGIATVHKAVHINVLETGILSFGEEFVQMVKGRVDSAVRAETEEVELLPALPDIVISGLYLLVFHQLMVTAGHIYLYEVLINDAAGAEIHVTYLGIAHLAVRKTYVLATGLKMGERILLAKRVDKRCTLGKDGVGLVLAAFSPAVKNHKKDFSVHIYLFLVSFNLANIQIVIVTLSQTIKHIEMKKTLAIIFAAALYGIAALAQDNATGSAQDNVHYRWMDSYGMNLPNSRKAFNPRKIDLPQVNGFNAYTADLHMHTIYSDAEVSPEMRVMEAYMEGVDILAITDHHPHPRRDRGSNDMNIAYDCAAKAAKNLDIKIIRGFEITGSEPVGHINVLFTGDLNKYILDGRFGPEECDRILEIARSEDAFITTNHPGWPDQNSDLSDYIIGHIQDGTIGAIEVFNSKEFYPLAIDHALRYKLAMFACTDSHYPTYMYFDQQNNHRDMTIIFAKDKSDEAIKEALRARRTLAWANNMVCGEEALLTEFLKASIQPVFVRELEGGKVHFRLFNSSSVPFYLSTEDNTENIYLPAGGYAESIRSKSSTENVFQADNLYCGSKAHPAFPLSFLLDDSGISQPYVKEESISFDGKGLSFSFAPVLGTVYYTLDGSEPDQDSFKYDGGLVKMTEPGTVKAVNMLGGKCSNVFERQMPFSMAGRFKGKKQGVRFSYYEEFDKYGTESVGSIGKLRESGVKKELEISEGVGKDYFAYLFEGVIRIDETGLYKFSLRTNDGSDLYIDDVLVCNNNVRVGYSIANGSVYLEKGLHRFRVRYFEGYGGESFCLKWQVPESNSFQDLPGEVLFIE